MVVGFATTYAISAYQHCQFEILFFLTMKNPRELYSSLCLYIVLKITDLVNLKYPILVTYIV